MARPQRVTTAIRFDPALHEALRETADELVVSMNWLVVRLCRVGLARIELPLRDEVDPLDQPGSTL